MRRRVAHGRIINNPALCNAFLSVDIYILLKLLGVVSNSDAIPFFLPVVADKFILSVVIYINFSVFESDGVVVCKSLRILIGHKVCKAHFIHIALKCK